MISVVEFREQRFKKIKWNMHESCQKSIERLKKIMNERAPLERREKKKKEITEGR